MEHREIQFHSLKKDELIYEVTVRSETPASTTDGLRKQMRKLIQEAPSETILDTNYSIEIELPIIAEKLQELHTIVLKWEKNRDRSSLCRAKALGYHLYYRLLRIQTSDPDLLSKKGNLSTKLELLLFKIEPQTEREHLDHSGDKGVTKWNLKFSGDTDVRSFLERAEELRCCFGLSDAKLFSSASQLFSDQALLWFRGIKSQVSSWSELKNLLLEEFDPVDYDYRLLGEIRARTQGVDERVHIYFSVMNCLFDRLKVPLSEQAKLDILQHNIRPTFACQLALVEITTISQLKEKCRLLEAAAQRSQLFVEPSKSTSGVLGSEFNYKVKNKSVSVVQQQNKIKFSQSKQKYNNVRKCYHCGSTTHLIKNCKFNKQIKCFSCGMLGCTKNTCPKCKVDSDKVNNSKNL